MVAGMILVDFAYSIHLATKITSAAKKNKIVISLDKLRESVREKTAEILKVNAPQNSKKKKKPNFFFPFKGSKNSVTDEINEYASKDKDKK